MLIEQERTQVTTNGLLEVTRATIKASAKVFGFFSDNTYSNNPVAIVRELVANAVDAHTAAGIPDAPVKVWLPTELDPTFRCQDTGIGMDRKFMTNNYAELGNGSSKDGDNTQMGGFGIGRFAAFSMVDQYTVRTVKDGIVGIYSIFKDEEGIPCVGLLGERPTDEPNGTEVSFPVKSEQFGLFANAANDALKYFNPLPIVHNGDIDVPDYVMRGTNWAMHRHAQALGVIMGGIRYGCNTYNLDYELRYDTKLAPLLDYGLDITVPIGACGIALSREALSYTPQTNAAIRAALEAIITDITDSFSTMFDHYETEWDAKVALMAEVPSEQAHGPRAKLLMSNAMYRGEPLDPYFEITGQHWEIESKTRKRGGGYRDCPNPKWNCDHQRKFRFDNYEHVIIDDLPVTGKSATIKRIKAFIDDTAERNKRSIVLRDPKFSLDIPADQFVYTSSLPEPPKAVRTKYDRPKVRMWKVSSLHDVSRNMNPGKYGRSGFREVDYHSQPTGGIMVVMDKFDLSYSTCNRIQVGLVSSHDLYFVNSSDAKKLGKAWVSFDVEFQKRLNDYVAANPELPAKLAVRYSSHCRAPLEDLKYIRLDTLPKSKQRAPIGRIIELREKYVSDITPRDLELAPFIDKVLPNKLSLEKLETAFRTQHPKAAHYLNMCGTIQPNTLDHTIFMELI